MERFRRLIDAQRRVNPTAGWDALERYLETGDESTLRTLAGAAGHVYLHGLVGQLNEPDALDEHDRRLLRAAVTTGQSRLLAEWVQRVGREPAGQDWFTPAAAALRAAGVTEDDATGIYVQSHAALHDGQPTSLGRHLLSLEPQALLPHLQVFYWLVVQEVLQLLLQFAPDKADVIVREQLKTNEPAEVLEVALRYGGARYYSAGRERWQAEKRPTERLKIARLLLEHGDDSIADEALTVARKWMPTARPNEVEWLLKRFGRTLLPDVATLLTRTAQDAWEEHARRLLVEKLPELLPPADAIAALMTVIEGEAEAQTKAEAVDRMLKLPGRDPALDERVAAVIEAGLTADARTAARFAPVAMRFAPQRFGDRLWQQVAGKKKTVREAAADALAAGDPQALSRAGAMLKEPKAEPRLGAAMVLGRMKTPEAVAALLRQLPGEADADVRDEISRGLREAGVSIEQIAEALGPVDLNALAVKANAIAAQPVKWLDVDELPALRFEDGTTVGRPLVAYMLFRQSRQSEPIPDPEVAGLYAMVDRRTSGDFAIKLFDAFIASAKGKTDAWALIPAGLFGDNRVVTSLAAKVRQWAEAGDQKLPAWGVAALAMNGSDAALMALESLASKYKDNPRRKFNLVGAAAHEALESTAKRLGISLEELADRIVPTLGFDAGRPRLIEAGKRTIEATIGLDFKLAMKDAATGKRAVSIPKTADPQVVAEFKGLGKLLVEVAKSEAARLEGLMVRQRRWPVAQWRERLLRQPLMFPFAVRLVWGVYDAAGKATATFRTLPDGSLTDVADDVVELPDDPAASSSTTTTIGLVHPLELAGDVIDAWRGHLGDYEVEQPFLQIDRPVVRLPAELADARVYDALNGAQASALGFRAKAEKAGWVHSGSSDGGMLSAMRRRFAWLGVDAHVLVDGVPLYADPSAQATLRGVLFVPTETPEPEWEAKHIRLADVPAMAFSEAVGDLTRITGRAAERA